MLKLSFLGQPKPVDWLVPELRRRGLLHREDQQDVMHGVYAQVGGVGGGRLWARRAARSCALHCQAGYSGQLKGCTPPVVRAESAPCRGECVHAWGCMACQGAKPAVPDLSRL